MSIGLAQKLAIRLNKTFGDTILLQLNAATLLSQYFGQSAVKIHSIFEALAAQSAETPKTLTVLLIDEIESIAASRETASARNEVHDAVRATNALLTGFDMVKNNANILIICTSNLSDSLDAAFIDRCGRHIKVPQPTLAARYEILRLSINGLIEREVIRASGVPLPIFRHAEYWVSADYKTPGCALRRLACQLENNIPNWQVVSARWLSQLAEIALANELGPKSVCTVDDAVNLMDRYVNVTCGHKRSKGSLSVADAEHDNLAKKPKTQHTAGSSNMQVNSIVFGNAGPADLEGKADQCMTLFREKAANRSYKPSPEEVDSVEERVLERWEFYGRCGCAGILGDRVRDYIEHGIPMDRGDY